MVEFAPPAVETTLLRGEFAEETRGQKAMSAPVLAKHAIAGIEAGKLEIQPGLARVLKAMSRVAPGVMLKQMAKMAKPKRRRRNEPYLKQQNGKATRFRDSASRQRYARYATTARAIPRA